MLLCIHHDCDRGQTARVGPLDPVLLFWAALLLVGILHSTALFADGAVYVPEYWAAVMSSPTFAQCQTQCALRDGGFVTSIESSSENNIIVGIIPNGVNQLMIGVNRVANVTGQWRWTEGPLGLENGGLGRIVPTGGSCASGTYCSWALGQPGGSDVVAGISSFLGFNIWSGSSNGSSSNGGCACKRFKSVFFTVPLPTIVTTLQNDCDTACFQVLPRSYTAWILSSDENDAVSELFWPRVEGYYVLGGNALGDNQNFIWTKIGKTFASRSSGCSSGAYCNFNTNQPTNGVSQSQIVIYSGNASNHETATWNDRNPTNTMNGCVCRYSPGTETASHTEEVTSEVTETNSFSQSEDLSITNTLTLTKTSTNTKSPRTPSNSQQSSETVSTTPSASVTPSETISKATVTEHVGYERFRYWFVEVSLPMQTSCNVFCGADGGFPAYATSAGENQRIMMSIPTHVHTALLGASRTYDSVNYRWVAGPLGARNQNHGAPFFNGPTLGTGACTLYCNFQTGMPNATSTATQVIMYGPASGALFGQWRNAEPGDGEGCLCMNIVFHTYSQNVSRSDSLTVSLTSPNPYWFYSLGTTANNFYQCRSACQKTIGGQMASIRSAYENQMALDVLPSNMNIGQVLLGGVLAGSGNTLSYYWSEGIFSSSYQKIWTGNSTFNGTCAQKFCNFVTANITETANLTLQEGTLVTMWVDGPLRGYWGEGVANNTKGCLCQRAETTVSARLTNTRSVPPTISESRSMTDSEEWSPTSSTSPSFEASNTVTLSNDITMSNSKTPSSTPSQTASDPPTFSNSVSEELSPSTTKSKSPVPLDFWFHPAQGATFSQCRKLCALRTNGFLATVENSVEAQQVFKTLPVNAKGMLGGSRLTDASNYRWTEGPLSIEDGGLGYLFYSGATDSGGGSCVTYCNWVTGQPASGSIAYAYATNNGQWKSGNDGIGTGCVCERHNTFSLRLSPSSTRNHTNTITVIATPSTTDSELPSLSGSGSSSKELSNSRSKTIRLSFSRTLIATPSPTTTASQSPETATEDPTPSHNTMSLSYQQSVSTTVSGPTLTLSESQEASLTPTLLESISLSPSKDISASRSTTNRTVGNLSPSKTQTPTQQQSESDSKESSLTVSASNEPSATETLNPSITQSKDSSSSVTVSKDKSFSARSMSQTDSVTPTETQQPSMSASINFSFTETRDFSESRSSSLSNSFTTSASFTQAKSKSLRSPSPTLTRPPPTHTGSLSLNPTLTKRKRTHSATLSVEPTPTQTGTFQLSETKSRSPSSSTSQEASRSASASADTNTAQVSFSASRTPNASHTASSSSSVSNSWEKTKASRSKSPNTTVTRLPTKTATISEELSPTRTMTLSESGSSTYSTTFSDTMSRDIASATVTRSPILSPTSSLSAEKGTASLSVSMLGSTSNTLSKEGNTVTVSSTPSVTISRSAPSVTSDISQTPTWIYSISRSKDLSMSLPTSTQSLTDDRSGSLSDSITNTVRIPTKSMSLSDSRDVTASKTLSKSSSAQMTVSVQSVTESWSLTLSNTSVLNSTTVDASWSKALTASRSKDSRSKSSEASETRTQSVSAGLSFTRSYSRGTKMATPTNSTSSEISVSWSFSAQVSVTRRTKTFPTPSQTRSLATTLTPTLVATPTHTISATQSLSATSSPSKTASLSRELSPSLTPTRDPTITNSKSRTSSTEKSVSHSATASLPLSFTNPYVSESISSSLSSAATLTLTRKVSESFKTPTIRTMLPLPFVFGPKGISSWSANGVPIVGLHVNVSQNGSIATSTSVVEYIDVTLYPVDEDGTASISPYRSPVAVSAESLPSYANRDILSVDAEGFPLSINITTEDAILPAHMVVSMNEGLPDPRCMAPVSTAIGGTVQVAIQYNLLNLEYWTQTALVAPISPSSSSSAALTLTDAPSYCLGAFSITQTEDEASQVPLSATSVFLVTDIPQVLVLYEKRVGYFMTSVHSMTLVAANTTQPLPVASVYGTPMQWIQLETTTDEEQIPFLLRYPSSVQSLVQNVIGVENATINVEVGEAHVAQLINATVLSCPARYDTLHATPQTLFNGSSGLVQMPYTAASAVEPGDNWTCSVSALHQPSSIIELSALRLHGCMLHCAVPDSFDRSGPLLVAVRSTSSQVLRQTQPFEVTTVAWPHTTFDASNAVVIGHARTTHIARVGNATTDIVSTTTILSAVDNASIVIPGNETLTYLDMELFAVLNSSIIGPNIPLLSLGFKVTNATSSLFDWSHQAAISVLNMNSSAISLLNDGSTIAVVFQGGWDVCGLAGSVNRTVQLVVQLERPVSTAPLNIHNAGITSTLQVTAHVQNISIQCGVFNCPQMGSIVLPSTNATINTTTTTNSSNDNVNVPSATSTTPSTIVSVSGCIIDVFPVTTSCIGGDRITIEFDQWWTYNTSILATTSNTSLALPWNDGYAFVLVRQTTAIINDTSMIEYLEYNCTNVTWFPLSSTVNCTLPTLPAAAVASMELRKGTIVEDDDGITSLVNVTAVAQLSNAVYYSDLKFDGCPKDASNATCADHGNCNVLTLACVCDSDAVLGYWSGTVCSVCTAGYYGAGCVGRCPGAGCSVCSGHGVCGDGEAGSGKCTCYNNANGGFWASSDCSDCATSYYGENCTTICVTDRVNGLVCGGHGTCSSGVSGNGQCSCDTGFTSTSTAACTVCLSGYYSSSCLACPTGVPSVACSGHGTCFDGVSGNGSCVCQLGYGGVGCSAACPVSFNTTCGWGSCAATSTCSCTWPIVVNVSIGTCSTCAAGYWGTRCVNTCACVHGTCSPRNGVCTCTYGYWGTSCSQVCPGGATTPCSGHGTCLPSNGTCICDANATSGYFTGSTCSTCDPLYNSPNCNVMCPYDAVTLVPCASRGTCYNGTCSGRCITGFYGPLCNQVCPGGAATPCTNHGTCDETSGVCTCDYGYAGSACQNICPPGDSTNPPCYNHGQCTDTGACSCYANATAGYWAGTSCNDCASSYAGALCNVLCNPSGGRVSGKTCVCSAGFVGASCNLICPTGGDDNTVCSSQGVCSAGNGTAAICTCSTDYFGAACDTYCTVSNCQTTLGLYRPQCNVNSGLCECQVSDRGSFTGPLCDMCSYGYWGAECDATCLCNNRACDRYTAACQCSAGIGGGSWAGDGCSSCAANYIGVGCVQRNIEVNNATSAMFSAMNDGFPAVGIACYDPLTAVVLVGSSPVGAFQTDPWSTLMAPLATITVPSQAIDCSVFNNTHLALTLMPTAPSQPLPIMLVQRWLLVDGIVTSSLINATTTITQSRMFTPSSTSNTTFTAVKRPNQTPLNASTSCVMFAEGATWTLQCSLLATGSFTLVLPATIVWMGFVGSVAVVTWTVPTSTLVWGMTIVRLPSQSNRTASILLTTNSQTVYLSDCEALNGCPVVGYCVSPQDAANSSNADATWSSSAIVCGASTALTTGNSLVFFALDYLTGLQIGASAVVPSASGISAAVLDVGFNNAIFSFVGATTAMLCRIQLSNPLALITLFSVDRINGDRPTVVQMSLNASTRTLWLSAATSEAVQAVAVNLFSISIVKPEVFDQRGGVTVTVTGVGFVPHPTPLCDFHSNDTLTSPSVSSTPAVFINATTLLCVAASVSMYDASCSTLSLNVWYGGRVTTTTLGSTTRPLSVTLDNATTADSGGMARTFHTADTVITLSGFGFVTSVTQATCRIEEADGTVVAVLPATPLSVTVAYCLQAVTITPTHLNAGVRYSHDGFVYSTSIAIFAVVGEWGGIQANALVSSNAASILTVKAQLASLIVAIEVQTTDSLGNVLGLLDSDSKQIICSSIDPVLLSDITAQQPLFTTSSSTILTTINGSVIFDNVQLSSPTTGTQTLYFFATLDRTISATFEIIVVPGNPASISLASGTSQASWASGVTTTFTIPAFYAVILDVVGNTVTDATNLPSSVTVQYTNTLPPVADTVGSAAQVVVVSYAATLDSKTSSYAFAGLSTMSPFNDFISLRFTTSDKTIQGLLYTMEQESCGTGSYGVQGGYVCFVCPADASCDGTTTIAAAPGYWRGTVTSPYLYACSPAQSCPSSTTCATGYEGAICGSCAAGYGRTVTSCDLCGSVVAPWIFVALIVVGFVVGVWFLALRSVAFSSPADVEARIVELPAKPSAVSILVKIALSHVQILSLLPLKRLAVGFVASALSSSGSWSVVTPGFLNVACAIGRRAVNEMYATVALAGLVGIGCCAVAWGTAYMDDRRFRAEAKRKAAAQRARVIKEAKASPVLFLAADEAHSAALFSSNKHCNEVLRNHKHLLEEYDGDLARNRVDPNDVQGWLNLEFDIDDNGSGTAGDFIPLVDLVASANGGSAPADGIAALGVRRPQIWKRAANLALLGFLVVTFLLYPTVVQAAVRVIQCRTVELGGGSAVSVVAYDPAIDCSTSDYIAGEVPAAAVLVAFGAGVPLLCPLAVMFARRYTCDQSLVRARQLFFFVTGGYRLWFWEGIVLARKAVIVVVVVLVGEDQVVCIICMWLLGAFLVLNLVLKPWEAERLGSLETLSLGALSLTCLCLAAFTSSGSVMSDGISIAMVVVVASLNGMVLLTLVGELSRQATNEVIELTGIEISPQWKIDSLRQQLAKITRQLRRRHFSRVADVSELLSEASEVTLAMLARRRQAIVTGASRMEMDRQRNEMIEKEKMMHLDWDPSTMSSSEPLDGVHDMYDDDYGSGKVNSKMRDDDFSMFLRPQTMVSHEDGSPRGVSRQRSVFFDMPEKPGSDDHNNEDTFSLHRRRASLFSPSSVRTTSRESLRLSNFSFRMEVLSDDAEDDSDSDEREVHPDIVNPFRQTCFEDNPWDVLVRSGQQREFLRSREQVITRDLGEVEALDMDATISTLTSSSEGSLDRQRFELRSRERASAFVRPSSSQSRWVQPIDDPIVFTAVDLPGFADDIEFDGDISVEDVELGHLGDTRVVVAPWGDELISPAMFDDDDELLVNATTTTGLPRRSRQSRKDADSNYKPQLVLFRSATTAKQSVLAAMHTLESQYLGAARAFWAVLADVRTASEMMSMQKVLSLNARLGVLLEELYVAEYTFLHMVWVYEHHVRTGLWDEVHEEPGGELITDGGERSGKESGLEVGALSSEDRYMTGSLDLNECDFESMDTATNDALRLR